MYPPVDTAFYRPKAAGRPVPADSRFLAVSALVPYKRLDLAIRAAAQARMPLSIVGRGPEEPRLKQLAASLKADVEFKGWLTDEEIRDLYQTCRAAVMPGVEDFGMVPVEAQACGRPVIALAEGGALESVVDGVTGMLVGEASVSAFADAMFETTRREFDGEAIRRHAEGFGKERFQREFQRVVLSDGSSSQEDPRAARYRQRRRTFAAREDEL